MPQGVSHAPLTPITFLERSAAVWGEHVATSFGDSTTTYRELLARCERIAGGLREYGVHATDRVAALLPNLPALLELHFAVPGSGAVFVPLNTRLAVEDYAYILEHAGARVLVTSADLAEKAEAAASTASHPPRVVVVDGPDSSYERMATEATPVKLGHVDEDSLFSINYTSGTTGRPKGVMYTHRGSYLHTLGVVAEARLGPSSTYLWTLPMFHCHGWAFTWAVTATGARHECLDRVDPAVIWAMLRERQITHMCAAPTVITMLLEADVAAPLEQPVSVFVGGAPPAPALLDRAQAIGMSITHLYGLTETYGPFVVCAWKPEWDELPQDQRARLRARQGIPTVVGLPMRVVDAEMNDVPADAETMGEVVMRGNNVMSGYYRDDAATAAAFSGEWFHSGDLGVMHPDGYIELRDRLKDIVVSGGENIATIEVEAALLAHGSVVEVAVVGVADHRWGEVVKAFVVRRTGSDVTESELREFARERLAHFKTPRLIEFVDELPKTPTGKIQKFVLRDRSCEPVVQTPPV